MANCPSPNEGVAGGNKEGAESGADGGAAEGDNARPLRLPRRLNEGAAGALGMGLSQVRRNARRGWGQLNDGAPSSAADEPVGGSCRRFAGALARRCVRNGAAFL